MENPKSTRIQRSEQEILLLMEEFEKCDTVSRKEFCEMNDISNATFYNWQKLYQAKNENPNTGFLSLDVIHSPGGATESILFAEVKGIKLYREVSASYLKELLQ